MAVDDRDVRRMMTQYEREAAEEGNQRARGINAVSNFVEKNNADFQKELGGTRTDIGRITEKASRLKVERMAGTEGIREIERSVSTVLNKVGYVFDIMGRGVVKISSITKETLQNYKNILQRELNISAPNTVAMALSRATPIFGYFAAKFMETGVFRKFSDAIKNKLSDAANVVGTKFKSMFGARSAARESTRVPQMQKGGIVSKTGLAQVHAAEVVVPVQKLFKEFSTMFRRTIRPVTSELGAIREQLAMISEPNAEQGPFGIYAMMRDMFKEIPIFKTFVKISDWMAKPLRWLFSTQSKYKAKVPKGPNVLGNIATTLGMIYADFMHKYDHIISSLKAIGMGLGVKQERFREPREKMEPTGVQKIKIGVRKVQRWLRPPKETGWESPSQKAEKVKKEKSLRSTFDILKKAGRLEKGMTRKKFVKARGAEELPFGEMGGGFFSDIIQKAWETMLGMTGVTTGEAQAGGVGGLGALRPKNIKRILFGGPGAGIKKEKKPGVVSSLWKKAFPKTKEAGKVKETGAPVGRKAGGVIEEALGKKEEIGFAIVLSDVGAKASRFFTKLIKDQFRPLFKDVTNIIKSSSKVVEKIGKDTGKIIDILKSAQRGISDYLVMAIGAIGGWVKNLMTKLNPLRYLRQIPRLLGGGLGKLGGLGMKGLATAGAAGIAAFGVYEMIQAFRGEKTIVGELFGAFGEWITGGKYKGPGWLGDLTYDIVQSASETVSKSIDSVVGYVKEKASAVVDLVLSPVNFMWDLAVKAKDWVIDMLKKHPLVRLVSGFVEGKGIETAKEMGREAVTGAKAIGAKAAEVGREVVTGAKTIGGAVAEKVTTVGEKLGSMIGIKKMPDVDIAGVQEPVWKNFALMAEEYKKETGKDTQLNSAYRSPAKQAELYRTNPYAAPPGKSPHGKGLALDINSGDAYGLKKEGLMEKYGFYQPMGNEPWHLQMKPQVGDASQFNVPYRRKDVVNGEVENAMLGINGMSQALNPMVGALDKSLKGVNAAIISNSNVITNMQSTQQGGGGGRQSGQGSFDPEIAAILSGNI